MTGIFTKDNIQAIPFGDTRYPKEWSDLPDAPKTLYAVGDISLLQSRKIVVVGSRRTPTYALKLGGQIAKDLSMQFTVTTGTADGGDGVAIEGALQGSGKVICLLAGGFSALPQANYDLLEWVAKKGLVLSPYEYETPIRAFSYEYRNKLLAALGEGTLVLGAAEKSGALITARYAKKFKKRIFALPYAPGSSAGVGCNALIKQGGCLMENATDVLEQFGINPTQRQTTVALSPEEERLLTVLRDCAEGHITELAAKANIPPYKVRAVLSALEVKNLVVALGGNRYAPI